MNRKPRRALLPALVLLTLAGGVAQAGEQAIIVLDASGSMWGQINGKPKLEIARETLATVLADTPDDMALGLMAYGLFMFVEARYHRIRAE